MSAIMPVKSGKVLEAIADWKAPYEVRHITRFHADTVSDCLQYLKREGLAEYHEGNNTYRTVRCPRCTQRPVDPVFLGTESEGHICGECWEADRRAGAAQARDPSAPQQKD